MDFLQVFAEFSERCGLGRFEQDRDPCLLFDDQHAVSFTCDPAERSVLFFAELCDLTALPPTMFRDLLEASLLGAQTQGAAFSVASDQGKLVLWKRHDEFRDISAFEAAINRFLATVITWKEKLAQGKTHTAREHISSEFLHC